MPEPWENIARRKQEERSARIPQEWRLQSLPHDSITDVTAIPRTCGLLTTNEIRITEDYDATALAEAIRGNKLKSIDVAVAFCKRAAIAQQLTNCLTEILFEPALRRAEYLDHYLSHYGEPIGPLHGVPISLKDPFRITSFDASIGLAALAFNPSQSNSPLVSLLISAGAIIHCKTNLPQGTGLDSVNNIFGRTLNPRNTRLSVGGSTGGEGALIAMRGSVLGVGTDIGGSIRVPAMCNGLYGLKPSANRIPFANQELGGMPGLSKMGIEASAGPLAFSLRDCELFMKTIAVAQPWLHDPSVIPGGWDTMDAGTNATPSTATNATATTLSATHPLTIVIMSTDGITTPLPPITRLLASVAHAVAAAGHIIHPAVTPPTLRTIQSVTNALFSLDGSNTFLDNLDIHSEPLVPWLSSRTRRKPVASLKDAATLLSKREQLMTEMLALWRTPSGEQVDAIICPVAPHPVPEIDRWNTAGYTSMWVLLDYPAGTVPVRDFDRRDLEGEIGNDPPLNAWDKRNRELWDTATVNREVYLGSPLCVQVVAPRLQEKRLYRAMQAVDDACRSHIRGRADRNNLAPVSSKFKL